MRIIVCVSSYNNGKKKLYHEQLKAYPIFLPLKNMFNAFQKFFPFRWNNLQKLLNTLFTGFDFLFLVEWKIYKTIHSWTMVSQKEKT